jgi:RND family efflux transporter MFP subunit
VLKLTVAVLALSLTTWGAKRWFFSGSNHTTEITASVVSGHLPIIVTERGELESAKTIEARCEVEGYQNKIATIVPEGTRVTKDQVVVTFDTDQLKRQRDDQEAKWIAAKGRAKVAEGELEMQRNKAATDDDKAQLALTLADLDVKKYIEGDYIVSLDKLKGEIELAKKDVVETTENVEKWRTLYRKGYQTLESLRARELELANKQYQLKSKENELKVLTDFTRVRQETEFRAKARDANRDLERTKKTGQAAIDKAQSDLDALRAAERTEKQTFDRLEKQLQKCTVKAPQDGILVYAKDRPWDMNARVQPGAMIHFQQPLFSLPDLGNMQIKVKIHEAMVKKIKPQQKTEIRIDAYPDLVLHGTVESVATLANSDRPWMDTGVKEYVTMVKIDDLPTEAGIKPGMTAEVKILVKELPDVLMLPVQAVSQKEKQHYAYVVGPTGVEKREVVVGEHNDNFVEIKEGLKETERVALDARARIAAETKASGSSPEELPKTQPPEPVPPTPPPAVPQK